MVFGNLGGFEMKIYGKPHINRIDGMTGVFRLWSDDLNQDSSRLVTRNSLVLLKLMIDKALAADDKAVEAKAAGGKVVA
jgi:hypothetical protein